MQVPAATWDQGSSPQVRGALNAGTLWVSPQGLIPAGAGSTSPPPAPEIPTRAHPRRCGEHLRDPDAARAERGSSPQVRGARKLGVDRRGAPGLIPAGAGSTGSRTPPRTRPGAHPRRCGEHALAAVEDGPTVGSSPQVRGAPNRVDHRRDEAGLIPAGAGSTLAWRAARRRRGAHPRRCGEHGGRSTRLGRTGGSSPQVRGARGAGVAEAASVGLIPAGAGSTSNPACKRVRSEAHPRRCGEHSTACQSPGIGWGSSPQVRGAPPSPPPGSNRPRLIPAGAGSTPTVRGGADTWVGSSPQVRGAPSRSSRQSLCGWLIPAGAGSTRSRRLTSARPWAHPRRCGEHVIAGEGA